MILVQYGINVKKIKVNPPPCPKPGDRDKENPAFSAGFLRILSKVFSGDRHQESGEAHFAFHRLALHNARNHDPFQEIHRRLRGCG